MRILITGVNGFIGQHLSKKLTDHGHKVVGIENKNGGVLNKNLIAQKMRNIEIVIHLAGITSHEAIVRRKFETLATNLEGTRNVLDAFSNSKTAKKFIFASSGKVYGKITHLPVTEEHPTSPLNILGKSKLITERLIDFYSDCQKEFVIFRVFNIYGIGQRENFLIPTIVSQVNSGKKEIILGDINAKRDYVYIDDLIDAFLKIIALKIRKSLSIYNISTGIGSSAKDIVKFIEVIKKKKINVKVNKKLLRIDEDKNEYGSFEKAKKTFGWKPKTTFRKGIQELLSENYKDELHAVIMAGGKGRRMKNDHPNTPKLLIQILKKPFLDHLLEYLSKNNCNKVTICSGYLGEMIKDYINQKKFNMSIKISNEKRSLGTGGALNLIRNETTSSFFLIFGDVYTKINLKKLLLFHEASNAAVTAVIHKSHHPQDSNLVEFNSGGKITRILIKPHGKKGSNFYNLAGIYVIGKEFWRHCFRKAKYDFEKDLLYKLVHEKIPIYAYNTPELIMDFGTPERLRKLEKLLK